MKKILQDNKNLILAILICLLAVSVVYRLTHPFNQSRVSSLTYTADSKGKGQKVNQKKTDAPSVQDKLIKLDLFLNPPVHSRALIKNIFSEKPAAEVKNPSSPEQKADQSKENEVTAPDNKNNIQDDLSNFRTFGYMESTGERILFIEKGKQIMLVRKGDRIEGKYLVKDITEKELTLMVITNNETVHIDLSDL